MRLSFLNNLLLLNSHNYKHIGKNISKNISSTLISNMSTTSPEEETRINVTSTKRGKDNIINGWYMEIGELWPGQAFSLKVKNILYEGKSKFQDVLVFESENYGNVLVLDGVIQVTERDEFSYQEMMAHLPLFGHKNPKRVLVIGGGDGGVIREICKHSNVEEIVLCEIDEDVINVSKKYLPSLACGYDDPRVKVHIMDGNEFMGKHADYFDVIITDSSDPIGPAEVLFETPFYKAMHAALRDGGIVCTQGECMWLHVDIIKPLLDSLRQVYSSVNFAYVCIPSYPSGQIGMIVVGKGESCGDLTTPSRTPSADVQKLLKYYTSDIHKAAFTLPAFARRSILGETNV